MPKLGLLVAAAALLTACGQDGIATTTGGPTGGAPANGGSGGVGNGGSGGAGASGGTGGVATGGGGASSSASTASTGGGGAAASSSSNGASSTSSSSTGSGGSGGMSCDNPGGPTIAQAGSSGFILRGKIVDGAGTAPFDGEVLVTGDTIRCVAASCAGSPGASTATVVETHGIVMPGMIDAHNHILFDIFDESDWSPTRAYGNHNQWTAEPRYSALVDCKQSLNGESGSNTDLGCEMDKYGELKAIVAGTTSVLGAANPANRKCYGSLARTIDQTPNGLPADKMQVATLFPTGSSADGVCDNFADGSTTAYVIHDGEGVDASALGEYAKLGTVTTTDGCLYDHRTTIVHGAAFGDNEFTSMATHGMNLVWSPKSNVFLYGAGTDLTKTANIPLARSKGINIALAPDWSIGGSVNLLDELRFAKKVGDGAFGGTITPEMLFEMVTLNAAKALALDAVIGSLAVGKKADITVFSGDTAAPFDALLAATPKEVRLVLVGGAVIYGDHGLESLAPASPGCDAIDVCCSPKFACVATTTSTDKLNQHYSDIVSAISDGLTDYDGAHHTQYTFAPIAPLVRCQ